MEDLPYLNEEYAPFDRAVDFLAKGRERGGVYGLCGSASAYLTACAVKRGSGPMLVIAPSGEEASAWRRDLAFYLHDDPTASQALTNRVLLYPSSDLLPYASSGFDTEMWITRMASLYRLAESGTPKVMVAGLDALCRRVIPRSAFSRTSFSVQTGEEIGRDDLLESLIAAGYRRSPLVEEPGDFSVRGFIIDIYPPMYPYPVRVEQVGDIIESIRFFDPTDQRSRKSLDEVHIGPISMLIPDEEGLERGLESIRETSEERGVEKRVRQRLIDDFSNRLSFPGAENYLPYFFDSLQVLFDYLPKTLTVVVPERETLVRAFELLEESVSRGWENAAAEGLPVPSPERLYMMRDEFFERIGQFRTVTMATLEVEGPDSFSVRLTCNANTDIRPEILRSGTYDSGMSVLVHKLAKWRWDDSEVCLVSRRRGQAQRLMKLLEPYALNIDYRGEGFDPSQLTSPAVPGIRMYVGDLSSGFHMPHIRRVMLTEEEIFGRRMRPVLKKRALGNLVSSLNDLVEGQAVVHEDYGIGVFRGLEKKQFEGIRSEVMVIEYAGGDRLYHPVERLQVIQKYVSGEEEAPRVDKLGGKGWAKTKARVKKSIRDMARELLDLYAKRQVAHREPYSAPDEHFAAFEASFDFEETPDQAKAIRDVLESMDSDRPMDRLVCGDVGYGKTEVALRAAFRAILDGKQVAILVPTTVLAQQHYDTCRKRFKNYPIQVEMLSRFRTSKEQKEIVRRLGEGKVDLIIGTHRLLSKDVEFKNLGLLVLDEEQRFGVTHKEKIKQFKAHVDVLTLTATPIPRTLHLSLSGIRDLSVIETPPENRKSIQTHVMRQSEDVVRDAIVRELSRGGQVFYLHNRVKSIYRRAEALRKLVPEASFAVAHGQMGERDLEKVMLDFVQGRCNVLVCTSIIESGLDIPRANTIVIERADTFGLADLYQLRGRVGRSNVRAYAYLLIPPESLMTPDAMKRLSVVQEHSSLSQGFKMAMRDMEIRGAGNILGTAQSGHVGQIGYEMYLELLEEAVKEMKGEEPVPKIDPEIQIRIEAFIPEDYVPDPRQRMNLYKRLSRAEDGSEIDEIEDEMLDLYGKMSEQVSHLITHMRIRLAMKELRIKRLDYNNSALVLSFDEHTPVSPDRLIQWSMSDPTKISFLSGDRVSYFIGKTDPETRTTECFKLFDMLRQGVEPNQAPSKSPMSS